MDSEGNNRKRKRASVGTAGNTSSASASGGKYEVFLSFRGNDTRKLFTDYLYNDLVDAGIRTFRDNEELRVGKEIGPELVKAINDSKISIPIFSRDYASSKWCLSELAQMVECQKNRGQQILPIFYDMEPSDIRHQTGSYKKAFRKHKKCFDEKTVLGWKEALREVGELKGWELKTETNGHQGKLAKMVSSKVLLELKKNYMVVTDNLVGIDHHVEEMMRLLNVDSNDARIVGIHGMGGIGKTTIAKVIYNQLSGCFESCCFVADVRERSQQHNDLLNLQNQIISKILKRKCPDIANVDDGINMIKDSVCGKKVLIVLDDVDEGSQFDKLAGKRDWFGSRSRIIVTTRDKKVLNVLEVDETYEPHVMGPDHSLKLFSKHAFRGDFPPKDYYILSRKVVSTAAGLPLALEVIGSFLFGEREAVWKGALKKLKKIPNGQVQEKLRISYEALEYEEKQMFLDIACLFVGEDKALASYMWNDCQFFPEIGINVLVLRSLVKIGENDELRMHDQLRGLGREIVRKENIKEQGGRSRLWFPEDALGVLKQQEGTKEVEALCLQTSNFSRTRMPQGHCFTNGHFKQLPNLRFLRVDHATLDGDFKCLLPKLRWLQWRKCPGTPTPCNFHLKNLVILDLSWSEIRDDSALWSQITMAKKLKVLNLSHCYGFRTPNFSTFANLEILILTSCSNLVRIDPLIGLSHLQTLHLHRCTGLQSLPKLPPRLTSLIVTCSSMKTFPSISNLVNLKELIFDDCYNLVEIPRDILKLTKLENLTLYDANISTLPEMGALSRLKKLKIRSCSKRHCILGLPSSSFELDLHWCRSVER